MDIDADIAKLAKQVQENFFAHQLFLPERLTRCTVLKAQELIIVNSHIADHVHNMVIRARLDDGTIVPTIATTQAYFEREGMVFSWWIAPDDTPARLPELLELNGLVHKQTYYALTLELDDAYTEQVDVHVERITTFEQLQDALRVVYQAYGDAPHIKAWYSQLLDYAPAEDDYERWYIAYQDEQPVAVMPLTVFADIAGIYQIILARVADRERIHRACIAELLGYAYTLGNAQASVVCTEEDIELYRDFGFDDLLTFERYEQQELMSDVDSI